MLFAGAKAQKVIRRWVALCWSELGDGMLRVEANSKSTEEGLLEATAESIGEELLTK